MKKVAFLTSSKLPNLIPDERPLLQEFQKRRFKAYPVVWDKESDWDQYDYVLVRNPWDYFHKSEQFIRVLHQIKSSKALLINKFETMIWNLDKSYMEELMNKDIPVTPTFKIEKFSQERFDEILMLIKSEEFVIKPVIGASGVDTFKKKTTLSSEEREQLLETFIDRDVLIQPFIKSILTEGEYSFMFFNKRYSHAVRKVAKTGEFRIQEEHGGRVEPYRASLQELEQVQMMLEKIEHEHFYARVDVVKDDKGQLILMEMELLEPQLFFTWGSNSASLFVDEFIKVFGR